MSPARKANRRYRRRLNSLVFEVVAARMIDELTAIVDSLPREPAQVQP